MTVAARFHYVAAPAELLLPELVYREDVEDRVHLPVDLQWAATVALSRELDAVITCNGSALSREDIGRYGLSIRRAWDDAAGNLIACATSDGTIAISLTPTTDWSATGWFELAVEATKATSWLAHPRTFTVLNDFLTSRLAATPCYLITDPSSPTLLVTGGTGDQIPTSGDLVTYQAGFPVPVNTTRLAATGAGFLLAS